MKDLAHQRRAEHLIEVGGAAGVAVAVIAGFHGNAGDLRAGASTLKFSLLLKARGGS